MEEKHTMENRNREMMELNIMRQNIGMLVFLILYIYGFTIHFKRHILLLKRCLQLWGVLEQEIIDLANGPFVWNMKNMKYEKFLHKLNLTHSSTLCTFWLGKLTMKCWNVSLILIKREESSFFLSYQLRLYSSGYSNTHTKK